MLADSRPHFWLHFIQVVQAGQPAFLLRHEEWKWCFAFLHLNQSAEAKIGMGHVIQWARSGWCCRLSWELKAAARRVGSKGEDEPALAREPNEANQSNNTTGH